MKAYFCFALVLLASAVSTAQPCQKTDSPDQLDSCFQSPGLKWAFDPVKDLTVEKMRSGPKYKPGLTPAERESGVVFCQYFQHDFSSPGSAKFLCARTTAEGVLLDSKGKPVPEARSVSTRGMKLQIEINGEIENVDEGILLDSSGRPLLRTKKSGEQEMIEVDELKVKYFINSDQADEANIKRGSYQMKFDQRTVSLENVFVGPNDITVPRWKEVFTEVAATRLFWALGLPADIMIPVKQVVCFGCLSHPMVQQDVDLSKTSVFKTALLERKYEGKKVGEQFNFNRITGRFYPHWSEEIRHEYEAMAIAAQLISYHHAISLQNRMQCADGYYDKKTKVCSMPVPFIQDVGSSFAGDTKEGGGRGVLESYQKAGVFARGNICRLYYKLGSDRFKDVINGGPALSEVSRAGLEKFKARLAGLTPDVVRALFETARFGDMDPQLRDSAPGAHLNEKRDYIIDQWTQALLEKIEEIQKKKCY